MYDIRKSPQDCLDHTTKWGQSKLLLKPFVFNSQKVGMGVLIYSIVDPRHGGLGAQPPAVVAYLTKDNPENPLLTHTAIKCN